MKKSSKRFACGMIIAAMALSSLAGCSGSTSASASAESASSTSGNTLSGDAQTDTTVEGMVKSIEGNEVTLMLGMGGGGQPGGEAPSGDGTAPSGEAPSGDGTAPSGEAPSGDGTAPSGTAPSGDGTAPEKPEGESESSNAESGESDASTPPAMPEGESGTAETSVLTIGDESVITVDGEQGSLSDIAEGSRLSITFDASGNITAIAVSSGGPGGDGGGSGAPGGNGGSAQGVDSYDAVETYESDTEVTDETVSSTGTDENAILVSADATVDLSGLTVDRTSTDSTGGDNSSFYGVGAAILGIAGTTNIANSTITTDAAGGAGVFAYGDGVVNVSDSTITTKQNTSGGIHVAGGGTLYATNLNVTTDGESAAAIRSDRGGGTMIVDGGTYTSNGVGSPAVYCTADIAVNGSTLTANGSEALCMEGLNNMHLFNCDITGNMSDLDVNDTTWTMIVYQSMSGDAEVGNATMQIVGGSITSENGGLIYTTNTESNILLSNVDITYADDSEFFLQCTGNSNERGWGTAGSNGAQCVFTADAQAMTGDIIWDNISELDMYMTNASTLTGAVINDTSYEGDGYCHLYISNDSTWTVTGDSTISELYNEGKIVDTDGKTVNIVGTDGTVYVTGDSAYTVTVDTYGDSADFSGAASAADWSTYQAKMSE